MKDHAWKVVLAAVVLAGIALALPGSPIYLPKLFRSTAAYEGHPLDYWIGALESPDAKVRRHAIFIVGKLGAEAGATVPTLAAILVESPDPDLRNEAALALVKMVPASRSAVAELARALEDKHHMVRMNAVIALVRLHKEAQPAVPALVKALQDQTNQTNVETFHFTIQEMAARSLGNATSGTAEGVPPLMAALQTAKTDHMKTILLQSLGTIGPPARPAVPQMRMFLKDRNQYVREAAQEALSRIGGENVENKDPNQASVKRPDLQPPKR
jgi:HEAT repeat protein